MSRDGGILLVYRRESSFVDIDAELLARSRSLRRLTGAPLGNPLAVARAVYGADLVFGWFAGWHMLVPTLVALVLRRPLVVVVGGIDTADLPDIGYGFQRSGPRRWMSRWIMRRASKLIANSRYSREEVERNVGVPAERVAVVHHGLADPFGSLPDPPPEPMALSVGVIDGRNLERKGQRLFVESAALLPDVSFVLVGRSDDDAIEELRRRAGPNVTLAGWIEPAELDDCYRRASVYVQPSRHEGFGMAVAEAMLAGCVPVFSPAGALPEVVGDTGVEIAGRSPDDVARAIRAGLELGTEVRRRARERVLEHFPLERREQGLNAAVEAALSKLDRGRPPP